jgi:hypothetical protein
VLEGWFLLPKEKRIESLGRGFVPEPRVLTARVRLISANQI